MTSKEIERSSQEPKVRARKFPSILGIHVLILGESQVRYIIAVIQPSRLEAVKESLSKVEVFRLTVSDVQGLGRQKGHTEVYRGHLPGEFGS